MPCGLFDRIGVELDRVFRGLRHHPEQLDDAWKLTLVVKGGGAFVSDGVKQAVSTGDVFVVKASRSYGFENSQGMELAVFTFRRGTLTPYEDDLLKIPGYTLLFIYGPSLSETGKSRNRIKLSPKQQVDVERLVFEFEVLSKREPLCDILLKLKFAELVVFLSQEYFDAEAEWQSLRLTKIGETIGFIRGHFRKTVKLEDLAKRSGMSVNNFLRVFKEVTGKTPMEYIILERVKYGGRLLAETSMRISEVAYASGFTDSNYFARQFRRFVDLSPREYRCLTALSCAKREKLEQ
ncbi:MAG: AraC family transcriptional regulator [Kiritimatiellaeota bacterium]|nr:AraC family transcriptional regulator [Kiritimatiellota bacterium]